MSDIACRWLTYAEAIATLAHAGSELMSWLTP